MAHTPTEYFPAKRVPVTERELLWHRLEVTGITPSDPFFQRCIAAQDRIEAWSPDSSGDALTEAYEVMCELEDQLAVREELIEEQDAQQAEAQRVTDDYPLTEFDGERWIDGRGVAR